MQRKEAAPTRHLVIAHTFLSSSTTDGRNSFEPLVTPPNIHRLLLSLCDSWYTQASSETRMSHKKGEPQVEKKDKGPLSCDWLDEMREGKKLRPEGPETGKDQWLPLSLCFQANKFLQASKKTGPSWSQPTEHMSYGHCGFPCSPSSPGHQEWSRRHALFAGEFCKQLRWLGMTKLQ